MFHKSESTAELILCHDYENHDDNHEWWMRDLPPLAEMQDDDLEDGEVLLPDGWWGGPPPAYNGPPTRLVQRGLLGISRAFIAGGRRRYTSNGFDLDLSYVTTKVIAMSFPCRGPSIVWRNPVWEVNSYLRWAHGDNFRIFNLCSEHGFQDNGFANETSCYPSPDHCPMSLAMLYHMCVDIEAYLKGGKQRVVAVHCKAGKGRTGTSICALLVYAGALTALDAVKWYACKRGGFSPGVTIPSQVRWIAMFEHFCRLSDAELRSNPITPGGLAYRLRSLRLGPMLDCFDEDDREECQKGIHDDSLEVIICLTDRDTISRSRSKVVFQYEPEIAELDQDHCVHIDLRQQSEAPIWRKLDGRLSLRICPLGRGRSTNCCHREHHELHAWWCHSFLQKSADGLVLDLPKGYLDHADSSFGDAFRVVATFEVISPDPMSRTT